MDEIIDLAIGRIKYLHKKDINRELFRDTIYLVYRDDRFIPYFIDYIFAERIPALIWPEDMDYAYYGLDWW